MRAKKTILMNNQNFVLTEAFKETLKNQLSELIETKLNTVNEFMKQYADKTRKWHTPGDDSVCIYYIGKVSNEISKIADILEQIHKCE